MDERLERHLCNLHNEVFEAAESRINTECSLIICEGISPGRKIKKQWLLFPHYMWGYIGAFWLIFVKNSVPSLYVRVYRPLLILQHNWIGSLIICEGISKNTAEQRRIWKFPHYMWGYIELKKCYEQLQGVPSLYVRVYRKGFYGMKDSTCSLIICEGISRHLNS